MWTRGIMYCLQCGYYAINKVEKLTETCIGKPINPVQKTILSRLIRGLHPTTGKALPLVEGSAPTGLQHLMATQPLLASPHLGTISTASQVLDPRF